MKNIRIQKEATIKANGKRENGNCKAVICIETGEVFSSATDAAERVGVHFSMISSACLGKVQTCKGKHYCYLNAALENLDAVMTRLRQAAAMEDDAKKWRAQENAKEEARMARERHKAAIAKAEAKVAKLAESCAKYQEKLNATMTAYDEANKELEALLEQGDDNNA